MCTAISVTVKENYFGRNFDYERGFNEKITITPRKFPFHFTNGRQLSKHFAFIGTALPKNDYPLYFEATNEVGLSIAGLNFEFEAKYGKCETEKDNVASFEFIPWILSQCKTVTEAEILLNKINITDIAFCEEIRPTPLHWIIADKNKAITVEQTDKGLRIFENPVGILTNGPAFDMQMQNLSNYKSLSPRQTENIFLKNICLPSSGRGTGSIGLPGDYTSQGRFVKSCFVKLNSLFCEKENDIVHQFFHILNSVSHQNGCVRLGNVCEVTRYSSCCNTDRGIYYYTTYYNSRINAVSMKSENLNCEKLIIYDMRRDEPINMQNQKTIFA